MPKKPMTVEARRVGELLQIRGDLPGGKWRTAESLEDRDTAEAVLERGGKVELPPKPTKEELDAAARVLGTASPEGKPGIFQNGVLVTEPDMKPVSYPPPPPAAAPPPPPAATARPICFLLEGADVPASPRTLEAAEALARSIAADAEAVDRHPAAKTAWKGARVLLGDLLREVVVFRFGAPADFRDGKGDFVVEGVR